MGRPPRISRDQILGTARTAFTEAGFAATTLAGIAAELGVTAAAILRHFPSKQDLFAAAMSSRGIALPAFLDELAETDGSADPRLVLRHFAEQMVPFASAVIRPAIAVNMHMAARQTTVVVPFDTTSEETPPRRGLKIVAAYFRRAMKAGRVRNGDPRAMALLFVGQLQAYVFLHRVLNVTPVYPLDDYLDAQIDLWTNGAIERGGSRVRKKAVAPDHPRAARSGRSGDGTRVRAQAARAEAPRPRRNDRGPDGERRVARGRTGHEGSRRRG
jgi:AcrR family transcriptional regulator